MPKYKSPFKYPLKSRAAIVQYLMRTGFDYPGYVLSFNVKIHHSNFEFDHLLKLHEENYGKLNPTQLELARQWFLTRYGEQYDTNEAQDKERNQLWNWAQEDAVRSVEEDEGLDTLRDGTPIAKTLEWRGRSGGYIVMPKFEGEDLNMSDSHFEEWAQAKEVGYDGKGGYIVPFPFLRKLYKYMVEMKYFLNNKAASDAVEYAASFTIFGNMISEELEKFSDDKVLIHV